MRIYGPLAKDESRDFKSQQAKALRRWNSGVALRNTSPVDILITGHSIAEGYYASLRPRRWMHYLLNRCHGSFGPGGKDSGLYSPVIHGVGVAAGWVDPWTRSGANANASDYSNYGFGLGRRFFLMNSAADYASYAFTGNRVWFLYSTGAGTGGLRVLIDGVQVAQIDTYAATGGISGKKWDSGYLTTNGAHTLRLEPISYGAIGGRYVAVIEGAIHFNGEHDAGVRVWDAAHSGMKASDFGNFGAGAWGGALYNGSGGAGVPTVSPALCIVQFGTNEYGQGVSAAQFKTDLGNHLNVLGASGSSILLVADWASGGPKADTTQRTEAGWLPYRDKVYELVQERGLAIADEYVLAGSFAGAGGAVDPMLITQDGVHPNDRGSVMIADFICDIIGVPKTQANEAKGFVSHGSVAATARPGGYASVEWYGSVAPTNAIAGDTWVDTST